ncbi:MAG TPA: TetR/AcrR family transcriptional regulator [Solirubrobacteraceae bacterium]|nr:TetR/AcrR family transcriptional regulator [Solirubrobacteraceae bacterium]
MARPVDPERRAELLRLAVDYAIEHGVADLTLRPLAEALGVRPNTLVHHFGGKERLLSEILNGVRDRLRGMRAAMAEQNGGDAVLATWRWTADEERLPFFRFFFEAYGVALRHPERYEAFLRRVVADWLPEGGEREATLELAVQRGLLLDLLTTGERERVEGALALFAELAAAV